MKLKRLQLHTPVFLGNTNLGDRLDIDKRAGTKLEYDEKAQLVIITFNNERGLIPLSAVAVMIPATVNDSKLVVAKPASVPVKAQVSTPTSHVFEGSGVEEK
jgi:hypothetical protein